MYVRTKKGEIFDCYESEQMHKPIYYPKKSKTNGYIDYKDVYKKSDNLIDILQEGDYVNGFLIEKIYDIFETNSNKLKEAHIKYAGEDFISQLYDTEIKSIVTCEQFESMKYKVEK